MNVKCSFDLFQYLVAQLVANLLILSSIEILNNVQNVHLIPMTGYLAVDPNCTLWKNPQSKYYFSLRYNGINFSWAFSMGSTRFYIGFFPIFETCWLFGGTKKFDNMVKILFSDHLLQLVNSLLRQKIVNLCLTCIK